MNAIDIDQFDCPYTDEDVAMPAATTENGNPTDCDITGANGVWYKFTGVGEGFITGTIASPAGTYSITFYTAPDETSTEDELVLVDYFENQCVLQQNQARIPYVDGQSYYCFVLNTGGVTDIEFTECTLDVTSNTIEGFTFYPNPANDRLNLTSVETIESVALYNILGQKVIDLNVNATNGQVDVSKLSVGAYIMKVTSNGQTGTYKVIKK
ncbi:MAG: T9SS type A sorting domain-containing protein [Flavobacteriaceae bacterium]